MTERQCIYMCLKALANWVLVAQDNNVLVIANQELSGLPLYTGRPVRMTGERKGDTIIGVAQKIRDATTAAEAAPLVTHLSILAAKIVDGGLAPAHAQMILILKAEGLEHAPR